MLGRLRAVRLKFRGAGQELRSAPLYGGKLMFDSALSACAVLLVSVASLIFSPRG